MTKVTKFLRRTSALTCVASIVSSAAFADAITVSSAIDEYTLEVAAPETVVVQPYVAPAPAYNPEPVVTQYNPQPVTDIYVEQAPAPEIYEAPVEADPEPVYVIQEAAPTPAAPAEPVYITEPVAQPVVETVTYAPAQPVAAPAAPAPAAPVTTYAPPPAPAAVAPVGPAPTVVAAPVAPVGGLGASGLGGAGLIAAGVGAAALIGIAAIALSDDDDDVVAATTTN